MSLNDMSALDKEMLLRWFEYYLSQDDRAALMKEMPGVYNRWMGQVVAISVRASDTLAVSKRGATVLLDETRDGFADELTRAKEAIADSNPNEYAYRILRANAALAQAMVWARQLGDVAAQDALVRAMDEVMTLADRTRLTFAPVAT